MSELLDRARAWLAHDPDPQTRAELAALIEQGESADLADRFDGTLEFGTAGLRGALGAGPNGSTIVGPVTKTLKSEEKFASSLSTCSQTCWRAKCCQPAARQP